MTDLETAAIKAALDVFENSAAFLLPVPHTGPQLYLACGEAGDIAALLKSNRSYSFAANETDAGSNISERIDSLPFTRGCQCPACKVTPHASDCAVHNAPALPVGPCDCGVRLLARQQARGCKPGCQCNGCAADIA